MNAPYRFHHLLEPGLRFDLALVITGLWATALLVSLAAATDSWGLAGLGVLAMLGNLTGVVRVDRQARRRADTTP